MEITENLVKEVLELNAQGYSREEMTKIIMKKYDYDEYYCFDTIGHIVSKARSKMTEAEKEQIEENRKNHKLQLQKNIATLAKEKAERDVNYSRTSDKLIQAVKSVALVKGIPESTIKKYLKTFYADFYEEYSTDAFMDEQYFIRLANKIIDKKWGKNEAETKMGYFRMVKYLEENNPQLLLQMKESFEQVRKEQPFKQNFEINTVKNSFNMSNFNLLVNIILEYRMPFDVICNFINENHDLFLIGINEITPEIFVNLIPRLSCTEKNSLEWYIAEIGLYNKENIPEEHVRRKAERFNEFCIKFKILKNDMIRLKKYVLAETFVNLSGVKRKVEEHEYGNYYGFENADVRNLLKAIYKYAFTELDVNERIGIPRVSKAAFLQNFVPENVDDEIILNGYNTLVQYNADLFFYYNGGSGSRK